MSFLLQPWNIFLVAFCGLANPRQQQIIVFRNAQIESLLKQPGTKRLLLNDDQRRLLDVKARDTRFMARRDFLDRNTDTEVVLLPPKSPNLNAYMGRWFRSLKSECLDRMVFFGRKSLENAVSDSVACSSTTTVALPDEPCHQSCLAYSRLTSWKVCRSPAITERFSPMSDHRKRINYSAQEKAAILRAHLVEGVPVSEVCQKHGISVTNFYNWQKMLFEGAEELFVRKPNSASVRRQEAAAEKKVAALEAKLVQKNEVIAELLQEHVQLKKVNGGALSRCWIPRDNWLTNDEKQAILKLHYKHPLEGYRRLTWMMMDANIVACSPGTVYNVLRRADVLRQRGKESHRGKGFVQPLKSNEHWHVDVAWINIAGTFVPMAPGSLQTTSNTS